MPLLDKDTVLANKASEYSDRQNYKALRDTFGLHDCTKKEQCYMEIEAAIFYIIENKSTSNLTELQINNILSFLR